MPFKWWIVDDHVEGGSPIMYALNSIVLIWKKLRNDVSVISQNTQSIFSEKDQFFPNNSQRLKKNHE